MPPIHPLTSLRFFAAFAVMALHFAVFRQDDKGYGSFLFDAVSAVTFFFVLSGFVLAYNYGGAFGSGRTSLRAFYAARAARIFPLHWLSLLLILPFTWDGVQLLQGKFGSPFWRVAGNASLIHCYPFSHSWRDGYNTPAWSLCVEWTMYLAFPFLIAGLTSPRGHIRFLALSLALPGYAWGWYFAGTTGASSPAGNLIHQFPPVRIIDFTVGCLLGLRFRRMQLTIPSSKLTRPRWSGTFAEAGVLVALAAFLAVAGRQEMWLRCMFTWNGYYLTVFAATIWVFANQLGHISKLLSNRLLVRLGEASFGLYMLHSIPIHWISWASHRYDFSMQEPWLWAFLLVAMPAFSLVVHRRFEIPTRDRMKRWLSPARKPAAVDVPLRKAA